MTVVATAAGAVGPVRRSRADALRAFVREFAVGFRRNLGDRRFWIVQVMVVGVTIGHGIIELLEGDREDLGAVYFVPATLYFFPVLYASLNFGREGAIPTAVWSAVLATPNVVLWHHGLQRFGEAFQLTSIIVYATVIATRVDREIAARREAEEKGDALRVSEVKYRSLFDSTGQPIIVFDGSMVVVEANAAASVLFARSLDGLKGARVRDVIGVPGEASLRAVVENGGHPPPDFALETAAGEVWLEPVCTRLPGNEGSLVLALFRDVTARRGFQSYAREVVRAQEEERTRISRDLHDVSLQSIVLLCRQLDAVEDAVGDDAPDPVQRPLSDARRMAEEIGADLRRFSRDLRPSVLDDLGLVPAIRNLMTDLTARSKLEGRFTLAGTPHRLPPNTEVALFRIVQECLRNVERHSAASRVTVRLSFRAEDVELRITDNGKGFQVPALPTDLVHSGRLGLLGLRERASLVGGACEISSAPGTGTRVIVKIPLTGQLDSGPAVSHSPLPPGQG